MTVYIDDMEADFGRMKMCHMIADTTEELLEMVDRIGVQRKWIQYPGTNSEHFDISLGKKKAAIDNGAKAITWLQLSCMTRYRDEFGILPTPGKAVHWIRCEIRNRKENQEQALKRLGMGDSERGLYE